MSRKKTIVGLSIFIFLAAVCWQLFFTYGIKFVFEDFDIFYLYLKDSDVQDLFRDKYLPGVSNPSKFSLVLAMLKSSAKSFFSIQRMFHVEFGNFDYSNFPYQYIYCDLFRTLFGDKVIFYKIIKILFFGINACILFLLINRISRLFAFLGVLLYISSSEIWLATIYLNHTALFAQCGVILSIVLFIKLIEKHPIRYKDTLFYYLLILITSGFAILMKVDGIYLSVIFFLTILFFRRKEIILHIPMLAIILLLQFPVLGYIKKIFKPDFIPIYLGDYGKTHTSLFESLKLIAINYKFPLNTIGIFTFTILCLAALTHLFHLLFYKNNNYLKTTDTLTLTLKERVFLFMLWFIASFALSASIDRFNYDGPFNFMLLRLSYFIAPFIIFLCYYVFLIARNTEKPYRVFFLGLCIFLMGLQIISNCIRLNRFRGGWGNYFCGWQNVEQYINNNSNKTSLVLAFSNTRYKPFLFRNSGNKILNSVVIKKKDFSEIINDTNKLFLDLIKEGYIDRAGIIQDKFRNLRNEFSMVLAPIYDSKRTEIYRVFGYADVLLFKESPFCDLGYIEHKFKEGGYDDIFVVGYEELQFRGKSQMIALKQVKVLDGDSGDLYDRVKRFMNRPSKLIMYIYHYKLKNSPLSKEINRP